MSADLTRLEEKIAYLERHVTEQDKVMMEFAEELARLKRELKALGGRLAASSSAPAEMDDAPERPPPHY